MTADCQCKNTTKKADSDWKVYRDSWENQRIMETYISAPIIDKQSDLIPTKTIEGAMDFYMKYGVYSYQHEEMPIGVPLAYKVEDDKVKLRVGIHDSLDMHDSVWKEIQQYGNKGTSSIRGESTKQKMVCPDGVSSCYNQIEDLGLWSVSWVGDNPANEEAKVTQVALAKQTDGKFRVIKSNQNQNDMTCTCNGEIMAKDEEKSEEIKEEETTPLSEEGTSEAEMEKQEEEELAEEEDLAKDLTDVKAMLAQVLDYLGSLEEKQDEELPEAEELELSGEEKSEDPEISVKEAVDTLQKSGFRVYGGAKQTPAPKAVKQPGKTNWLEFSKSFDEIDNMKGDN